MSEEALMKAMTSLVKVLRELLANMEEEQKAIIDQDAFAFQQIMSGRDSLIQMMQNSRADMMQELDLLSQQHPELPFFESEKDKLLNLAQLAGEDHVELLTLRDQILALTEKMERQNVSNNSLLGNQVSEGAPDKETYSHQYKPIKRRVHTKKNPVQPKKTSLKTIEISSEEK